jgi:hypothetical protein
MFGGASLQRESSSKKIDESKHFKTQCIIATNLIIC